MAVDVAVVEPEFEAPTRADIAEALTHLNHHAKRQIPKPGTPDFPTAWDKAHALIDARLYEWQAAQ
jgi:hypothetical protein